MKQVWIPGIGDPSVLEVREAPDPSPGPGEVRVRVEAAGVNFADLMARIGVYPDAPPLPAVVGYEVAGVVDAVGEGVPAERVGQAVVSPTRFGGYSSMVVVPAVQALPLPPGLDTVTAASIPVVGLTAWMMLEEMVRVRPGDRVLVHAAAGGVGLAALDLIRHRGGTAVGTASASKHAWLRERGYAELVDYRTEDFEAALLGGPRFDAVLDPVGGESWAKSFRLLKPGGRLVVYGMSSNAGETRSLWRALVNLWRVPWLTFNPIRLTGENKGVAGVNMGRLWQETALLSGWLRQLLELTEAGVFRPHVHATVPFSRAAEAHQLIHDRKNVGKVLLVPD